MAKKIVKKKKLRVFRLLLLLFVVAMIVFFVYSYVVSDIKNIIIKGNNYVTDEEILQSSGLYDYPSFVMTMSNLVENKIEKNQ